MIVSIFISGYFFAMYFFISAFQRFWFGAVAVDVIRRKWPCLLVCAAIVSATVCAIPWSLAWLMKNLRASFATSALNADTRIPCFAACLSAGATAFGSSAEIVIAAG